MDNNQDNSASLSVLSLSNTQLSPVQAMHILFSHPYCNFLSYFFIQTREIETGFFFVNRCKELLDEYSTEIPEEEVLHIEFHITSLELCLYDYSNQWQAYLDFFETIFQQKRTKPYILTYSIYSGDAEKRFQRYLLGFDKKGLANVHYLYLSERRRSVIERKLRRQQEGKNVNYFKRHQKEQLSEQEQTQKFKEMERLFKRIQKGNT